jgi:hypothetical protein
MSARRPAILKEVSSGFPQPLQTNSGRPLSFPSKAFPIHSHTLIAISFDAIKSDTEKRH